MKNIIRSRSGSSVIFFDSAFLFYRGFSEEKNNDRDDRENPPDAHKNRNTKARNCTVIFFLLDRALQLDGNIFVWLNYFSTPCWTLDLVGS